MQGMCYSAARLLRAGLKPVYVFDGQPPYLKREVLRERISRSEEVVNKLGKAIEIGDDENIEKYNKQTVRMTKQHNEDCRKAPKAHGNACN